MLMVALGLAIVGAGSAYAPTIERRFPTEGYAAFVPTTIAIVAADYSPDAPEDGMLGIVMQREKELRPWQLRLAVRREGMPSTPDLQRAILTRATWPEGAPIAVTLNPDDLPESRFGFRVIEATFERAEDGPVRVLSPGGTWYLDGPPDNMRCLPSMTVGQHEIACDVHIKLIGRQSIEIGRRCIRKQITVVPGDTNLVTPVRTKHLDSEIVRSLLLTASVSRGEPAQGLLFLSSSMRSSARGTMAVGLRIEFIRNGDVVSTVGLPADDMLSRRWCEFDRVANAAFFEALSARSEGHGRTLADRFAGWTLRITGDPDLALSDFDAITYWDGLIEVPLAYVLSESHFR
jgi:hypothetical protein